MYYQGTFFFKSVENNPLSPRISGQTFIFAGYILHQMFSYILEKEKKHDQWTWSKPFPPPLGYGLFTLKYFYIVLKSTLSVFRLLNAMMNILLM